ncbi:ferredoxin [Streptomyces sp. 846.5]|nr:ferredoxin [Streptomyces sp. 846.5]TDT98322.1 ferredoxin [Streptomyces sp. 846.5]
MKVRVDPDRCQGHTLCAMRAPEIFELSEIDGHASVVDEDVPADQEDQVNEAVMSCPERAISIVTRAGTPS